MPSDLTLQYRFGPYRVEKGEPTRSAGKVSMGAGFYSTDTKTLILLVRFMYDPSDPVLALPPDHLDQWERAFKYASQALAHATRFRDPVQGINSPGVRIGRVEFVIAETGNPSQADIWVTSGNGAHTDTIGGLASGTAAHITVGQRNLTTPGHIVHELGHYAFGLWDEDSGPAGGNQFCIDPANRQASGLCIMQTAGKSVALSPSQADWWSSPPYSSS